MLTEGLDKISNYHDDVEIGSEKLVANDLTGGGEPLAAEVASEVPLDPVVDSSMNFSLLMRKYPTPTFFDSHHTYLIHPPHNHHSTNNLAIIPYQPSFIFTQPPSAKGNYDVSLV